jgi:hypothetical protein
MNSLGGGVTTWEEVGEALRDPQAWSDRRRAERLKFEKARERQQLAQQAAEAQNNAAAEATQQPPQQPLAPVEERKEVQTAGTQEQPTPQQQTVNAEHVPAPLDTTTQQQQPAQQDTPMPAVDNAFAPQPPRTPTANHSTRDRVSVQLNEQAVKELDQAIQKAMLEGGGGDAQQQQQQQSARRAPSPTTRRSRQHTPSASMSGTTGVGATPMQLDNTAGL